MLIVILGVALLAVSLIAVQLWMDKQILVEKTIRIEEIDKELVRIRQYQLRSPGQDVPPIQRVYMPSASGLSGDILYPQYLGDGEWFFAVGDVISHDISAATHTFLIRGVLSAIPTADLRDLYQVARKIDVQLREVGTTATMLFFIYKPDPRGATIRYFNCEHVPPIIIRNQEPEVLSDTCHAFMLGDDPPVFSAWDLEPAEIRLGLEDSFCVYTDGLVECMLEGKAVTSEGFCRLIRRFGRAIPAAKEIARSTGGAVTDDILVMEIYGQETSPL